jgi:putative colanic acid biosynthesis acetyltransferase WcaF
VGRQVQIHPSVRIFVPWNLSIGDWSSIGFDALVYNLGPISIGSRVTVSQRSHLCGGTHDHRDPGMRLIKAKIAVGNDAWVCADAFLGPNIEVGAGAIVGARAVVTRSVANWRIVAGNPAREIGTRIMNRAGASDGG